MKGAISNQIVKCIIYYNDGNRYKAEQKLREIIEEKLGCGINMTSCYGINMTSCYKGSYYSEVRFNDGEEWILSNVNSNAKDLRWRKAYVDIDIPREIVDCAIKPCGDLYKWEDYKEY